LPSATQTCLLCRAVYACSKPGQPEAQRQTDRRREGVRDTEREKGMYACVCVSVSVCVCARDSDVDGQSSLCVATSCAAVQRVRQCCSCTDSSQATQPPAAGQPATMQYAQIANRPVHMYTTTRHSQFQQLRQPTNTPDDSVTNAYTRELSFIHPGQFQSSHSLFYRLVPYVKPRSTR